MQLGHSATCSTTIPGKGSTAKTQAVHLASGLAENSARGDRGDWRPTNICGWNSMFWECALNRGPAICGWNSCFENARSTEAQHALIHSKVSHRKTHLTHIHIYTYETHRYEYNILDDILHMASYCTHWYEYTFYTHVTYVTAHWYEYSFSMTDYTWHLAH